MEMAYNIMKRAAGNAIASVPELSGADIQIPVSFTKAEIPGDFTLTLFPLVKSLRKSPKEIADMLSPFLMAEGIIEKTELSGGFLNVFVKNSYWAQLVQSTDFSYVLPAEQPQTVVVEFSSPNTNKPLHLGHVRNILLGESMARIFASLGHKVFRVQVVNDRGIAICKSMLIYTLQGNGASPESNGIKGDHYVGDLYVSFEKAFREEYKNWQGSPPGRELLASLNVKDLPEDEFFARYKNTYFNEYSELGQSARKMLQQWEAGDEQAVSLWQTMNGWVYQGFQETYDKLGIRFDHSYYESQTYLLGKEIIEEGLTRNIFYREADGSVWVDLTDKGLDKKILLRADGTSVYITQDLGTAVQRFRELNYDSMVYVVADEQNYHFEVLFNTLALMGYPFAEHLYHLSYGMVELPTGKMKSREGTVVDADDLIAEVIGEATEAGESRGDLSETSAVERQDIYTKVGLAALKYHMLKVQARKKMVFDPKESVDMQGQTGPYIQNAYVRILSILRKAEVYDIQDFSDVAIASQELTLIKELLQYTQSVHEAAAQYDPSLLAHYLYQLAKSFHRFYHDLQVLNADSPQVIAWRILLIKRVAAVLADGMGLLGIDMPLRM